MFSWFNAKISRKGARVQFPAVVFVYLCCCILLVFGCFFGVSFIGAKLRSLMTSSDAETDYKTFIATIILSLCWANYSWALPQFSPLYKQIVPAVPEVRS